MTPAAQAGGRTTEAIAAAVGTGRAFMAEILSSERRRGHVERTPDGGWRLTAKAEQRYGHALRALGHLDGNGRLRA